MRFNEVIRELRFDPHNLAAVNGCYFMVFIGRWIRYFRIHTNAGKHELTECSFYQMPQTDWTASAAFRREVASLLP